MTNNNKHGFQNQGVITDPPSPFDCSSLREIVQEAVSSSQLKVDRRGYSIIAHIPASKFAEAKPFLEKQFLPAEGYNASPSASLSDGNWFDPTKRIWVPEPIVLVRSYMTGEILQRNLGRMLLDYSEMGKSLNQKAMAIEIMTNNVMLIIPTE